MSKDMTCGPHSIYLKETCKKPVYFGVFIAVQNVRVFKNKTHGSNTCFCLYECDILDMVQTHVRFPSFLLMHPKKGYLDSNVKGAYRGTYAAPNYYK